MPRLYFAYGSNMDPEQFGSRCPNSRTLGTATLASYRFINTARGYASLPAKHMAEPTVVGQPNIE